VIGAPFSSGGADMRSSLQPAARARLACLGPVLASHTVEGGALVKPGARGAAGAIPSPAAP
jgi:hypothetical protein